MTIALTDAHWEIAHAIALTFVNALLIKYPMQRCTLSVIKS
jgi:hypothetical protein